MSWNLVKGRSDKRLLEWNPTVLHISPIKGEDERLAASGDVAHHTPDPCDGRSDLVNGAPKHPFEAFTPEREVFLDVDRIWIGEQLQRDAVHKRNRHMHEPP